MWQSIINIRHLWPFLCRLLVASKIIEGNNVSQALLQTCNFATLMITNSLLPSLTRSLSLTVLVYLWHVLWRWSNSFQSKWCDQMIWCVIPVSYCVLEWQVSHYKQWELTNKKHIMIILCLRNPNELYFPSVQAIIVHNRCWPWSDLFMALIIQTVYYEILIWWRTI